MSMCGHESARQQTETWLTPPEILRALGAFDLDPCCPPFMPWTTAARMLTPEDDGLAHPWAGRVWLNPPWGHKATPWLERLAAHGNGIALLPARTETRAFFAHVWGAGRRRPVRAGPPVLPPPRRDEGGGTRLRTDCAESLRRGPRTQPRGLWDGRVRALVERPASR